MAIITSLNICFFFSITLNKIWNQACFFSTLLIESFGSVMADKNRELICIVSMLKCCVVLHPEPVVTPPATQWAGRCVENSNTS